MKSFPSCLIYIGKSRDMPKKKKENAFTNYPII